MLEALNAYSNAFSTVFYLRQVIVISAIFIIGLLITLSMYEEGENVIRTALLAFPMGLSVFAVIGYVMLVVGIPYRKAVILPLLGIIATLIIVCGYKKEMLIREIIRNRKRFVAICLGAALVVACVSCAGFTPVSISNDSMYRLHMYPKYIVYFGHIRDQFDTFLTDTSLGVAVIETLPFLFGYDEGFGLREFLYIDLVAYFMYMTYLRLNRISTNVTQGEEIAESGDKGSDSGKLKYIAISFIAGFAFALSSPAFIVGHWAMSNMLFMTLFFFAVVEASELNGKKQTVLRVLPVALLMIASAEMRAEGGIFVILLIICCMLLDTDSKLLSLMVALPLLVLNGAYALKIFTTYTIDNPYTFLTPGKSVIQAIAFAGIIIYGLFIRDRLPDKIMKFMPEIYILGLILVNGALFAYNRELFLADANAFLQNLVKNSGWGMVTELSIASGIAIAGYFIAMKVKGVKVSRNMVDIYYFVITVGFFLVTLAVSFMRGDELSVQVGDSGNRVLLQVIPLVIYTLMLYFVRIYECDREYTGK